MQHGAFWQLQFRAWAASNHAQHHSPYGPSTVWPPKPSAGGTAKVRRPPTAMPAMPACMDERWTALTANQRLMVAGAKRMPVCLSTTNAID